MCFKNIIVIIIKKTNIESSIDPNPRLYQAPRGIKSFYLMSTYNIFIININTIYGRHIIFFIIFYFVRKEHYNIYPIHGFKTMCKALLKPWVV